MENLVLNAMPREGTGKGVARKARKAGRTPGVVYRAGGSATPVSFDITELATIFRKTNDRNSLINVLLEGAGARHCLVREVQRDPVSRSVVHVDFYEVEPDYVVTAEVALGTTGRAFGTRAGGTLRLMARSVTVRCAAGAIPNVIEFDVSALDVGQFIQVSQIPQPDGVKIMYTRDFNIATVEGKRGKEEGTPAAPEKKA